MKLKTVEGLYCKRPIQCLALFRNIDLPTPSPPVECVSPPPPAFGAGGGHTRWVERGWGVNSSEDARHCSALFICKYFVHGKDYRYSLLVIVIKEVCYTIRSDGGDGGGGWKGGGGGGLLSGL